MTLVPVLDDSGENVLDARGNQIFAEMALDPTIVVDDDGTLVLDARGNVITAP